MKEYLTTKSCMDKKDIQQLFKGVNSMTDKFQPKQNNQR